MSPRERLRWLGEHAGALVFGLLLILGLVFLDPLREWFSIGTSGEDGEAASKKTEAGGVAPAVELSDAARSKLREALGPYERIRALLAADSLTGIDEHAAEIEEAMSAAGNLEADLPGPASSALDGARSAAAELGRAADLTSARHAFGELSRHLLTVMELDPRLQEDQYLFECPMAPGFRRWVQPSAELENPYMGSEMLACGGAVAFSKAPAVSGVAISHEGHGHEGSDIAYYTCSMHPSVKRDEPGKCPICNMDLTPVTHDEQEGGVLWVDALRRQKIGVRTGEVRTQRVQETIRAVGRVTYDETRVADVTLKTRGWIGQVFADSMGMRVERGQALFAVYSPEVYAAQGDLLTALSAAPVTLGGEGLESPLADVARQRLSLLDAAGLEKALREKGKPLRYLTVGSPMAGYVVEKNVVSGGAVEAGERVYRIAGLDTIWIEASVYEDELAAIEVGAVASVTLPTMPGRAFSGTVAYVYPYLDPRSRTGRVRIEVGNPELELKPAMFADVELVVDHGDKLVVDESAVIYTGPRRLVFLDLGDGRLKPQVVELGPLVGGVYEVLGGLREGQRVVTSGNFLIAAESRIRSALRFWMPETPPPDASPEKPPAPPPPTSVPIQKPPAPAKKAPVPPKKPDAAIYTCPMHPEVRQNAPGKCPICSMPLERVSP